jgi:hypothetical protein
MNKVESGEQGAGGEGMSNDRIAAALARLTQADGAEPTLYVKAMEQAEAPSPVRLVLRRPAVRIGVAAMLVIAAGIGGTVMYRDTGSGSFGQRVSNPSMYGAAAPVAEAAEAQRPSGFADYRKAEPGNSQYKAAIDRDGSGAAEAQRQIVHKASMDLLVADVRSAYMKSLLLLSEADGEFAQNSGLSGSDNAMSGTLTLRVVASRLPAVMQRLRELGKVSSEVVNGEDVTDRMVDLAARLRNEERIERELHELLDSRKGSPLKDLLEVREQLSQVRGRIEQLKAQQAAAERSVAYATILVTLHAQAEAPKPVPEATFGDKLEMAAGEGLRSAQDSVLWLARTAISGAVWWAAIAVGVGGAVIVSRRVKRAAAREAAPAV